MVRFWQNWLRSALAAMLLLSCNAMAPALASARAAAPAAESSGDCHGAQGDETGMLSVCEMTCVAIPSVHQPLDLPKPAIFEFRLPAIAALEGRALLPATPPPRSA